MSVSRVMTIYRGSEGAETTRLYGDLFLRGAVDPAAMSALLNARVPCNQAMADHSSVQCLDEDDGYSVGLLGILNGYFGVYDDEPFRGWGPIVASLTMDGRVEEFEETRRSSFGVLRDGVAGAEDGLCG